MIIFLYFGLPLCPQSVLIIGWWSSNPEQRPQRHYNLYLYDDLVTTFVYMVLVTRYSTSYLPKSSPPISSYAAASTSLTPVRYRNSYSHHIFPLTFPVSIPSPRRGPELILLRCIAQLCSTSSEHTPPSIQIPLPAPDTLRLAPSLPSIVNNLSQLLREFHRFPKTSGQ